MVELYGFGQLLHSLLSSLALFICFSILFPAFSPFLHDGNPDGRPQRQCNHKDQDGGPAVCSGKVRRFQAWKLALLEGNDNSPGYRNHEASIKPRFRWSPPQAPLANRPAAGCSNRSN